MDHDKSLVAWYRCEDITGNSLINEKSGNTINLSGVTLISGGSPRDGKSAIVFDGNSYGSVATPAWFNNEGIQTICLWFKGTKLAATQRIFASPGGADNNRMYISIDASNNLEFTIGSTTRDIVAAANWDDTKWNHVAVVRDATNNKMWAYFNGVLAVNDQSAAFTTKTNDFTAFVGALATNLTEVWTGQVDDIRIYNRFLTEAEVKYIMYGRSYASKSFGMK